MAAADTERRRRRDDWKARRTSARRLLALVLTLAVVGVALLLNGAESWWSRIVVHAVLAAALVLGLRLPTARLQKTAAVLPLLAVPALVFLFAAPTLIPLPTGLLATLAPGTAAAFPDQAHALSIDPEATAYGLGVLGLVAGTVVMSGLALPRRRRLRPERAASIALLVLGLIFGVHRLLQPDALYGLIPVKAVGGAQSAPLINANFVATVVLGLLPLAVGGLSRRRDPNRPWTWVVLAGVLAGLAVIAGVGSLGAVLVLVLLLLVAGLRLLTRIFAPSLAGFAPVLGVVLGVVLFIPAVWLESTVDPTSSVGHRLVQWSRSLALFAEHPVSGTGLGAYRVAFEPHTLPFDAATYTHLHSDPGQLLLELGVVPTVIITAVLLWSCWPAMRRPQEQAAWWASLGVIGIVLHSLVDFPLHLPGILLLATLLLTWRVVGLGPPRDGSAGVMRVVLGGLIVVQLAAIGLTAWLGPVRAAAPKLLVGTPDPAQVAWVAAAAPWRAEPWLVEARELAREGKVADATPLAYAAITRNPADPAVLTQGAGIIALGGSLDTAADLLDRAILRDPADFRSRALASRVAEARGDDALALAHWTAAIQRWPWPALVEEKPFERAFQLQPLGLYWIDALADGPEPHISVYLGYVLLDRGEPFEALIAFEQAMAGEERYRWVPRYGVALAETGQVDRAIAFLDEADAHDTTGEARMRRARLLLAAGRWEEAREDAYVAMSKRRDYVQARLIVLEATEQLEGGEAALERARFVVGSPEDASAGEARLLARIAEDLARFPDCVDWLDGLVEPPRDLVIQRARCLEACRTCREEE